MSSTPDGSPLHYEHFFETSGDLLCVLHRDGRFLRANHAFFEVLGYTEERLVGQNFVSLVHPDDASPVRALSGSADKYQAVLRMEGRFLHRDGSYRTLSFSLRRLSGRAELYGIGHVAGTEPAHQKWRRWQLIQVMQSTARVGAWEVDCATMEHYWTEETFRLHEVPPGFTPTIESGINFYTPDSLPIISAAFTACLNEGKPYDLELQIVTAKGRLRWVRATGVAVLEDGKVLRVLGAFQDIDDYKRREVELEEKLAIIEQQRSAIQALSAPIIQVWDDVLALPVVGLLDKERAEEIMGRMLDEIMESRARYAILDLTGVNSVDEVTADHVVRILRAIQLLGAQGLVTGIRPRVARTLTSLGADFAGVTTLRNLREAIKVCMRERDDEAALLAE